MTPNWVNQDEMNLKVGDLFQIKSGYPAGTVRDAKFPLWYQLVIAIRDEYFSCIVYRPDMDGSYKAKQETFSFPIRRDLWVKIEGEQRSEIVFAINVDLLERVARDLRRYKDSLELHLCVSNLSQANV